VALTRHKPVFYTDVTGTVYDLEHLKGKRVCLISGIADPDYFARTVSISGCSIGERLDFSDHHRYTQHDVERIRKIFDRDDIDAAVMTRKDHVKMRDLDISSIEDRSYILHVVIDIMEGREDIIAGLDSSVSS